MSFGIAKCAGDEGVGWEIISAAHWWHTPVHAALWSFSSGQRVIENMAPQRQFRGSLFCERFSVDLPSQTSSNERRTHYGDDALNVELDGVKSAMEALSVYERDVGFHLDLEITPLVSQGGVDLGVVIDEKDLLDRKQLWDKLVEDLMTGPAFDNDADSDESLESSFNGEDLLRSTSTISSIGTSFSEGSIESIGMPSTPKPKSSYGDVEIKDISPAGSVNGSMDYYLSPSRSLSVSASSFVPGVLPQLNDQPLQFPSLARCSPQASFANFTFPTLNRPLPSEIKRNNEAYCWETQPESPGAGLLPPFLQEPQSQRHRSRKSRTREMVDRLRSQVLPGDAISPKFASHSSSPISDHSNVVTPRLSVSEDGSRPSTPSCEEEDGWIDLTQPSSSSSSPAQKTRRTRDLFLALTRRRTDSLSSENVKDMMAPETSLTSPQPPSQNVSLESSSSQHSPLSLTDGWIEAVVPPLDPKKKLKNPLKSSKDSLQHIRKKSSNHTSRASTASSNSHSLHPHHPHSHGISPTSQHYPHHPHQLYQYPHQQYQHHPHATSPYLPYQQHKHHPSMTVTPTVMPYFFPAYPTVVMPAPVPFTAFMHMPPAPAAYHIPGTVQPTHVAPHHPMYGAASAAQQPTLLRGQIPPPSTPKLPSISTTTSPTTNMNMNLTPGIYKGSYPPLWGHPQNST